MSNVNATIEGWVTCDGVPVLLAVGDEYPESHPLVQARPDLFTEPKRGPGRPPSAKSRADG